MYCVVMSDQTQTSSTPQTAVKKNSKGDQNPLDVLEEILNDAKNKGQKSDPNAPTPEQIAAQKEVEELKKAEALMQERQQEDVQKMVEQIGELDSIKQTPEYQARVEQIEEKKQEEVSQQQAQDGYEIEQLQHTKI